MDVRLKQAVLAFYGYVCLKCGSDSNLTVDHVRPKAKGGSDMANNLQALCAICNLAKGTATIDYRNSRIMPQDFLERAQKSICMGRPQQLREPTNLSVLVEREQREWLRRAADSEGKSMGDLVRGYIQREMLS